MSLASRSLLRQGQAVSCPSLIAASRVPRAAFSSCRQCRADHEQPRAPREPRRLLSEVDAKGRPLQRRKQEEEEKKKNKWWPRIRLVLGLTFLGVLYYDMHTNPLDPEHPDEHLEQPSIAERDALTRRESGVTDRSSMRLRMQQFIEEQQHEIVSQLEQIDGTRFVRDSWQRKEGGGGTSCVLQDGNVFEKAGVNVSVVYGTLPRPAIQRMRANHKAIDPDVESLQFFAAGLSIVLHPHNPMVPTIHLNVRYFETANPDGSPMAWWFGGGTDLTPSYLFDEDAIHFHRTLKTACDNHDKAFYPRFKKWCDEYFQVKHRGEARGVGGIFFDDLDEQEKDSENLFGFVQDTAKAFLPSYVPILLKRKDMSYGDQEKAWQQLRRGRYVEFNLVHDRGTAFGLNTPGARVESILMSLPRTASWRYRHEPDMGSREERMVKVLRQPVEWV